MTRFESLFNPESLLLQMETKSSERLHSTEESPPIFLQFTGVAFTSERPGLHFVRRNQTWDYLCKITPLAFAC